MFSLCPLCVSAAAMDVMDGMDILAPRWMDVWCCMFVYFVLCVLSVSVWDLCGDGVCTEMDGGRNTDDL